MKLNINITHAESVQNSKSKQNNVLSRLLISLRKSNSRFMLETNSNDMENYYLLR